MDESKSTAGHTSVGAGGDKSSINTTENSSSSFFDSLVQTPSSPDAGFLARYRPASRSSSNITAIAAKPDIGACFWPREARRTLRNIGRDQHQLVAAWGGDDNSGGDEEEEVLEQGRKQGQGFSVIQTQLKELLKNKQVEFTLLGVFSVEEQPASPAAPTADTRTTTITTLLIAVRPSSLSRDDAKDVVSGVCALIDL